MLRTADIMFRASFSISVRLLTGFAAKERTLERDAAKS